MYKAKLCTAFFMFVLLNLFQRHPYAQTLRIDSLKFVLTIAKADSNKVNVLNDLSRESDNSGNSDSALQFALMAKALSEKIGFKRGTGKAYNNIGNVYQGLSNYNEALKNYFLSLKIRKEIGDKRDMAWSYNNIGQVFRFQGNYSEALKNFLSSLRICEDIHEKRGSAIAYLQIALFYHAKGDLQEALRNYLLSMKISESLNDLAGINNVYYNIQEIYLNAQNYSAALSQHSKWLKLVNTLGTKKDVVNAYGSLGWIYESQKNYDESLINYFLVIKKLEEIGEAELTADFYLPIGRVYIKLNKSTEAQFYLSKALDYYKLKQSKEGVANFYYNIGNIYENQAENESNSLHRDRLYNEVLKCYLISLNLSKEAGQNENVIVALYANLIQPYTNLKKYDEAEEYCNKTLIFYKKTGDLNGVKDANKILYSLNEVRGNYKKAIGYYKDYVTFRDSISNEENTKKNTQLLMNYDFDKKTIADSVQIAEERKVNEIKFKQEKTQRWALYGGLTLLLLFAIFIFNRFKVAQKQKRIIEIKERETQHQKHLVEAKNHEITDSINYAQNIQRTLLASESLLNENLNDYFLLYKPKDIVSGDFYWAANTTEGFILITADCTGHGVPGAFMSLLCISYLNEIVKEQKQVRPDKVFNLLRERIITNFHLGDTNKERKDGMDAVICKFNFNTNVLHLTAANNPVWIIRNKELLEYKADKMPVGVALGEQEPFTLQTIQLQKEDIVYTFSDGFADQFSQDDKKLMKKKFKELLLSIQNKSMSEQKDFLGNYIETWRGTMEQTDDILVIGVRV